MTFLNRDFINGQMRRLRYSVAQILVLIERFLLNRQVPVDLRFLTDILPLLTSNVVPVSIP
jgi:hypothetical protein